MRKVLMLDHHPDNLEIINTLSNRGYKVICAKNSNEVIKFAKEELPSLIILDIILPVKYSFNLCKILRLQPEFKDTLIIFLTAFDDDQAEIEALKIGADEYIKKPINPEILVSRINLWFRRAGVMNGDAEKGKEAKEIYSNLQFGDLCINKEKYNVSYKNVPVMLARKEFELLEFLSSSPGKVFRRKEILDNVWEINSMIDDHTIDVHVSKIHKKLKINCIKVVKGVGYKFELST